MTITRHGVMANLSLAVARGDTVYLAGQVARTGSTVAEQTADVLEQIDELLAKAGTDKSKLLSANIWLTDISTFNEMNDVWTSWVAPGQTPARATVEAKLADPKFLVEIMATAAIG
ncbi:MAG: RidA family protein [Actinomycetia bacterium]|nr:RidA family protein [Actinomycetes bacterium]